MHRSVSVWLLAVLISTAAAADPAPDMRAQAQSLIAACRADYAQFCSSVAPGGGRILACLAAQNPQALSASCREALPRARALAAQAVQNGVMPK